MELEKADIKDAELSAVPFSKEANASSARFMLPIDYDELRLFSLLKWRFGEPNGLITFCGIPGGDPDAPFKWDFEFAPCDNLTLSIIRHSHGIEILCRGADLGHSQILKYFEGNLKKYSSEIDEEITKLEAYTLILNPYVRHRAIAQHALKELDSISLVEPKTPSLHTTKKEITKYNRLYLKYLERVEKQTSLTFLLVMESAFMAEAYLNLILAVFTRTEIKNSSNIFTETLMKKWKSKIERLHIDCNYIKTNPDLGDSRIRDAKLMFDRRNQLAHSYPDKNDLKLGIMWFHKSFPVLPTAVPFQKYAIALQNQLPSVDGARDSWKAANGFINFLNDQIEPGFVDEFKTFAEANPLGFNETKNIFGVPFGKAFVSFFIPSK